VTRGCGHLSGPGSQRLGTGLLWPGQSWQGGNGDSRDTSTFVTSCPIGMSLPADSSCEGRVSLHFTQSGISMPAAAGVVDEKGSEYILAHRAEGVGRAPPGGVWVGGWFSSRLYYPFGKGPGQHIIRCLKNEKCENERIGQNIMRIVLRKKLRGHSGIARNSRISRRARGEEVGAESIVTKGANLRSPKTNTNAQRMLLLSYLLRSPWYPLVPNCWSFPCSLQ